MPAPGRAAALSVASITALLVIPFIVYGFLAWRHFDTISLTAYIPVEELHTALGQLSYSDWFNAPLVTANLTSDVVIGALYTLTLGQLTIALILGSLIGANFAAIRAQPQVCAGSRTASASAAGAGLLSTVSGSVTWFSSCCGSGASGALLSLAGVSSTVATSFVDIAISAQIVAVIGLAFIYLRLRRRLKLFNDPSQTVDSLNST